MGQLHVKLLKTARHRIADGRSDFICRALDCAEEILCNEGVPKRHVVRCVDELQKTIQQRLAGEKILECWLIDKGFIAEQWPESDEPRIRATRLAWIDSLIKEFRSAK